MPQNIPNKKSTLIQVMAWCSQARSHYLSQHWSMSSYGVTRPHWVNVIVCLACWAGNIQPLCYSILWVLSRINKQVWLWQLDAHNGINIDVELLQGCQPLETHFSNKLQWFQYFCIILHKFQYFCAETTSVAYRYRKSISIIELFVSIISIYIVFLATIF